MKNIIKYIMLLSGIITIPLQRIIAQEKDSLLHQNYSFLLHSDAWINSNNGAALSRLGDTHLSNAELSFHNEHGYFANYNDAPKFHHFDANVESFYRLNPKIVFYGKLIYRNASSKDVAGSAFINPERQPFNIVEFTDDNTGRKHLDLYQLEGAFSWNAYKRLHLGTKIEYTAANYTKYKDLRHKNNLMDMTIMPSIYFPLTTYLNIGLNFYYRRNTETLRFNTYGTNDKVYISLIDYGAFWGKKENFGERGYTESNREMPLFSEHTGWEMQAEVMLSRNLSLYNDFLWAKRHGYYGKKSPYTVSYNQHNSKEFVYNGKLSLHQKNSRHDFDALLSIENLTNFSNSYRSTTDSKTSASYYDYFSPVKLANKVWTFGKIQYTGSYGINGLSCRWMVLAGLNFMERKQTAYLYPYYQRQKLKSREPFIKIERNIDLHKSILSLGAGTSYYKGSGNVFTDGTFIPPSEKQEAPPIMESYLFREYQFLTCPHYTMNAKAKYTFIFPHTNMATYAEASINYNHLNGESTWFIDKSRISTTLIIGCTF